LLILLVEHQGHGAFNVILKLDALAGRRDGTRRLANVQDVPDFRASTAELVIVKYLRCESLFRTRQFMTAATFIAVEAISSPSWGAPRFGSLDPTPAWG